MHTILHLSDSGSQKGEASDPVLRKGKASGSRLLEGAASDLGSWEEGHSLLLALFLHTATGK